MKPHRYNEGDKVIITDENLKTMMNSNRSSVTPNYPSDDFITEARQFSSNVGLGEIGTVTHTFPPGYEVSVRFGTRVFHMKDHWITPMTAHQVRHDLIGKLAAEGAKDLSDAEIDRVFDSVTLPDFCKDQVRRARNAGITLEEMFEAAGVQSAQPAQPQL